MSTDHASKPLDGAVTIFIATALAYAVAFAYESAFLKHFAVPIYLAEVELRALLLCLAAMTGFFYFLNALLTFWPASWPVGFNLTIIRAIAFASLLGILGYALRYWILGWLIPWSIAVGWIYLELLLPLKRHKAIPGYTAKLQASFEQEGSQNNALGWLLDRFGRGRSIAVAFAILTCFAGSLAGTLQASRMRDFLVSGNCIVLRVRGETALCSEFRGQTLTGHIRYLSAKDLDLKLMRIGPIEDFRLKSLDEAEQQ